MSDNTRYVYRSSDLGGVMGPLWIMGWLFTIGFLHLTFLKGVLALVLWPYFLGVVFRR